MKKNQFVVSTQKNLLTVTFSSSIDSVESVINSSKMFIEEKNKSDRIDFFSLRLILLESLTNAVKHGNCLDLKKQVGFSLRLKKTCVEIDIKDMGNGFDWKKTLKNDIPDLTSHGRGIHIIKEYSSLFRYNSNGNQVHIVLNYK